jgi:hypothetical protein
MCICVAGACLNYRKLIKPKAKLAMGNALGHGLGDPDLVLAGVDNDKIVPEPVHFHKGQHRGRLSRRLSRRYKDRRKMNPASAENSFK